MSGVAIGVYYLHMTAVSVTAPVPDFVAARAAMIDSQLKPQGVNDPAVLAAMARVPREEFVAPDARPIAYGDRAVPIGAGRLMSPPAVLGLLLTQLAPVAGERALVVGAGTGYSAAVLAAMGVAVTAVESSGELAGRAPAAAPPIEQGPLQDGFPGNAPYDMLLIDGAVESIPDALIAQLADGGRLGASLVERGIARLVSGRRAGDSFGCQAFSDAAAAPLPGFERPRGFTF